MGEGPHLPACWEMGAQLLLAPSAFTRITGQSTPMHGDGGQSLLGSIWGSPGTRGSNSCSCNIYRGSHGVGPAIQYSRRGGLFQAVRPHFALHPSSGEAHWEILLRARAVECQSYVIAAAQAGRHNEKRESYGHSLIIDPWGRCEFPGWGR